MIVKGAVKISDDGKTWKTAGAFEFGNLKNDPTRRNFHFTEAVKARYVRLEANREIDSKLMEYDLF